MEILRPEMGRQDRKIGKRRSQAQLPAESRGAKREAVAIAGTLDYVGVHRPLRGLVFCPFGAQSDHFSAHERNHPVTQHRWRRVSVLRFFKPFGILQVLHTL